MLSLLLLLVSCGGSKGSQSSNTDESVEQLESQVTKEKQMDCLENALGWTQNPPEDKEEALKHLSGAKFEKCASAEIMDLYIERVILAHPQLQF